MGREGGGTARGRDGEHHMMRIFGVRAAGPALPSRQPRCKDDSGVFLRFFFLCPVGSDFGDEEGAARRAVERQERSVEGTEGWSSFEKPCEGLGLFYGGCGVCEGPHTAQLGAGTSLKFGERERCSEGCRRGCNPAPHYWGHGGDRMQRKDGGEFGGDEGVKPPCGCHRTRRECRGRVGGSCRGGSKECRIGGQDGAPCMGGV